MLWC